MRAKLRDTPIDSAKDGRSRALVFVVAAIAYSWTLALPFQFDDYWLLPSADAQLGRMATVLGVVDDPRAPRVLVEQPLIDHLFQPCLWALYQLEASISGRPYQPTVFHGGALILHALASLLLHALMRRLLQPAAALAGALFFALHPAGSQAVSWVAAGGDLLSLVFMLSALLVATGGRMGSGRAGIAGSLAALAFASKVSGMAVLGLLVPLVLFRSRGGSLGRHVFSSLTLLVPTLVALGARRLYLETWSFGYWGGTRVDFGNLHELPQALPRLLTQLVLPWNPLEEARVHDGLIQSSFGKLSPELPRARLIWIWVLPLTLALTARRSARALACTAGAALIIGLPALFPWRVFLNVEDNSLGRTLYPLVPVLAFVLAAGAEALKARPRLRVVMLALFLTVSVDTLQHIGRCELAAARAVSIRHRGVARELAADPEAVVVVLDAKPDYAAIPLTSSAIQIRFLEPFAKVSRPVRFHPTMEHLLRSGLLRKESRSVRIVEWQAGSMIPRAALPAITQDPGFPRLVLRKAGLIEMEAPLVPRAYAGLEFHLAPGASGPLELRMENQNGVVDRLRFDAGRKAESFTVALDRRRSWMLAPSVTALRVLGDPDLVARLQEAPRFHATLPRLEPRAPALDARFPMWEKVVLEVEGISPAAVLEVVYRIDVASLILTMTYEVHPADRNDDGGIGRFTAGSGRLVKTSIPELSFASLPGLFERYMVPLNVDHLRVIWSVSEKAGPKLHGRRTPPAWFDYERRER